MLLAFADYDVAGYLLDARLPLGEALKLLDDLFLGDLTSGIGWVFKHFGKCVGAVVDAHLQRANESQFGQLIDQRLITRFTRLLLPRLLLLLLAILFLDLYQGFNHLL